jgi:hypothetical protein
MAINDISQVAPCFFSFKKFATIAAANILRIGIGLATATSANPAGQDPGFYRAGDKATAAAREGQTPIPAVVERPDFGWG